MVPISIVWRQGFPKKQGGYCIRLVEVKGENESDLLLLTGTLWFPTTHQSIHPLLLASKFCVSFSLSNTSIAITYTETIPSAAVGAHLPDSVVLYPGQGYYSDANPVYPSCLAAFTSAKSISAPVSGKTDPVHISLYVTMTGAPCTRWTPTTCSINSLPLSLTMSYVLSITSRMLIRIFTMKLGAKILDNLGVKDVIQAGTN